MSGAVAPSLDEEDQARAGFYGLVARLFHRAPDDQVLAGILHADPFGAANSEIALAWRDLAAASRKAFPVQLEDEHTTLFVGTGKAEVTPYLSYYVLAHTIDNPLVDLRQKLGQWGIARREEATEPEDHIAALFEAMRFAIAVQHRRLKDQQGFFQQFIYRGACAFCDAVNASPKARFYLPVARFTRAFIDIEHEAFEIG
ncbi:MAG: molecular chaperone [Betaproteobacteria bacterium]|nr:molecular chaperone [Betaproteobacteria bacterium]